MWLKLKNISFKESELIEDDFTNTFLEWADFAYCNLEKSIFSKTNLKKQILYEHIISQ